MGDLSLKETPSVNFHWISETLTDSNLGCSQTKPPTNYNLANHHVIYKPDLTKPIQKYLPKARQNLTYPNLLVNLSLPNLS